MLCRHGEGVESRKLVRVAHDGHQIAHGETVVAWGLGVEIAVPYHAHDGDAGLAADTAGLDGVVKQGAVLGEGEPGQVQQAGGVL